MGNSVNTVNELAIIDLAYPTEATPLCIKVHGVHCGWLGAYVSLLISQLQKVPFYKPRYQTTVTQFVSSSVLYIFPAHCCMSTYFVLAHAIVCSYE